MSAPAQLIDAFARPLARARVRDIITWAAEHVRLPGSARSERFDPDITPWLREPLAALLDGATRIVTFIKPVQSGGSTLGEVALCYWLSCESGDVQYNWEDDDKARDRWDKRTERILRACDAIVWPRDRYKDQKGLVMFPRGNFTMQGVFSPSNLDSDSVRFQVNEEIHNWEPGRLSMAYDRTTAYWNAQVLNISNASAVGDQLHTEFDSATRQHWEVKCPACRRYHRMRTRWDDKQPELGGLRYDSAKRPDGTYDYARLAQTLRYQFPCGHTVGADDLRARRALSLSGRYSAPDNPGAPPNRRSYTLDAVAVDYIPWLDLVNEKHKALRALHSGDPEPWRRYLTRRECIFYDPEDRPIVQRIVLSTVKKDRAGLRGHPDFAGRYFGVDRQQGTLAKGELPHWWLVMRDALRTGNSLLVFEGKLLTDEDLIETLHRHQVIMHHGVIDSSWDTRHVYQLCLQHGINATKAESQPWFSHPDGAGRKIFSPEKPLWQMVNYDGPTRADPLTEPQFWHHSQIGLLDRLHWLRASTLIKWEVPADVSEAYHSHLAAWEPISYKRGRTQETVPGWKQVRERDDLHWCERAIAMLMEMAGLIGGVEVTA
jgi:hypothetical protein